MSYKFEIGNKAILSLPKENLFNNRVCEIVDILKDSNAHYANGTKAPVYLVKTRLLKEEKDITIRQPEWNLRKY